MGRASLPETRWSHTSALVRFEHLQGARVLIVGGRQSAFEWAALLVEAGAAAIHIVHRHDPPSFETSHWAFVDELMDNTIRIPGWFRRLSAAERDAIVQRFWAEGRLKLEPWLTPRLAEGIVHRLARTAIASCRELPTGEIEVKLSSGEHLEVDHVLFATGYKPNLANIAYLHPLLDRIETIDGFPVLDEHFQTSVRGTLHARLRRHPRFRPVLRIRPWLPGRRHPDRRRPPRPPRTAPITARRHAQRVVDIELDPALIRWFRPEPRGTRPQVLRFRYPDGCTRGGCGHCGAVPGSPNSATRTR